MRLFMFERKPDYPCAVSDFSEEGCNAALQWCAKYLQSGQYLTLWTPEKRTLRNNTFLKSLSQKNRVKSTTLREYAYQANGPVLAMYPNPEDLGYVVNGSGITALVIVTWSFPLDTWAQETNAEILVPPSFNNESRADHHLPVEEPMRAEIIEGLVKITTLINHNNTIAARGYEKSRVIDVLLPLHDSGVYLPPQQMMEWAAAHGWWGDNVKELGRYATDINNGKRPRK